MPRDRLPHLLIPVAALLAVLPLLLQGPSCGHDFDFHLLNWFEAAAQFRHGNLHPLWAVSPAFNAGEPRFLFYPPISWTLGALLGLAVPQSLGGWAATPIAYTWLALTASGLAMHRLARAHASPTASLLAATLYLVNPYMLFTAYERTAYAELLAAAWLPLLLHAILKPRPTIPGIALPLALLWLTNAPAAVMGTYILAFLALIRLTQSTRVPHPSQPHRDGWGLSHLASHPTIRLAFTTLSATALGLSLAAFYIVPAATERPFVQIAMAVIPGMQIADNTLFHHTGFTEDALAHDAVLHTASVIAVALLAITASQLVAARRSSLILPLLALTATIAFLLTPNSLPLWNHLPELAFLQFPWRLLAVLATVFGLTTALAINRLNLRPLPLTVTACALALLAFPAARRYRQPCDLPDTVPARLAQFQSNAGSDPTDEYTPTPADNDSLKPNSPPYWLAQNPDAPPPTNATPGPSPHDLDLTSPIPQHLILNLRVYPDWHITLNAHEVHPADPRADGLIVLPIPAGHLHLHLAFVESPREHTAAALSFIAIPILLALWLKERRSLTEPTLGDPYPQPDPKPEVQT